MVKKGQLEEITRLATDRDNLRVRLVLDERHRHLERVARVGTREASERSR